MKLHGEVALNVVPREIGDDVGAALNLELSPNGGRASCVGDRIVFDAYPPDVGAPEDARTLLANALYQAFEKCGVHWTELSWSARTYDVGEPYLDRAPQVAEVRSADAGRQASDRRAALHLVKG